MLAPAIGAWALIIAAAVGAMIWAGTGDGGSCDRTALAAALAKGISVADQRGQAQFDVVRPVDCSESDLAAIVPEVTRKCT